MTQVHDTVFNLWDRNPSDHYTLNSNHSIPSTPFESQLARHCHLIKPLLRTKHQLDPTWQWCLRYESRSTTVHH